MNEIIARRLSAADVNGQGSYSVFDPSLWKIRRRQLVSVLNRYIDFAVRRCARWVRDAGRVSRRAAAPGGIGLCLVGRETGSRVCPSRWRPNRRNSYRRLQVFGCIERHRKATEGVLPDSGLCIPGVTGWAPTPAFESMDATCCCGLRAILWCHIIDAGVFEEIGQRIEGVVGKSCRRTTGARPGGPAILPGLPIPKAMPVVWERA